jgi:hypothetical protein
VDFVLELAPSTVQLSNLMPADGTALRERLEAQGRIRKVGYLDADLYSEVVEHPAFEPGQIHSAIFEGYRRIYEGLGPSIYRVLDTWWTGFQNLRRHANPALRRRAELYGARSKALLPLFLRTQEYLPNDEVRYRVRQTLAEITGELGAPSAEQEGRAELVARIFALEQAKREHLEEKPIEPELMVRDYAPLRVPAAAAQPA